MIDGSKPGDLLRYQHLGELEFGWTRKEDGVFIEETAWYSGYGNSRDEKLVTLDEARRPGYHQRRHPSGVGSARGKAKPSRAAS